MNKPQRLIVAGGAVGLVLMILCPPFFGIDRESDGRRHAFMGYHAVWDRPSSAAVYRQLTSRDPAGVEPSRLASFEARVNVVRLTLNAFGLGILVAVGASMTGGRARGA